MTDFKDDNSEYYPKVNLSIVPKKMLEEFPEPFSKVRVFGSYKNPLIVAKDVAEALGINRLEGDRFSDSECKKIKIDTPIGKREYLVLTMSGLYKAMATGRTELSDKFWKFIVIVLEELRNEGYVTTDNALRKLRRQLEEERKADVERIKQETDEKLAVLGKKVGMLDGQLVEEHKKLREQTELADNYRNESRVMVEENNFLKSKTKVLEKTQEAKDEAYIDLIKKRYMKKVNVIIVKPPREKKKEYEEEDGTEFDPESVDDYDHDNTYIYSLSFNDEKTGKIMNPPLYVHKGVTAADIHKHLCDSELGIKNKSGIYYNNKYEVSFDELKSSIDEYMKEWLIENEAKVNPMGL
jgi:prophage antirepressor-like protein